MKEFGLDIGLLLSQIVNFGLLAFVLYLLLYKPLLRKIEERAARIRKGLEDAERAEKLAAEADEHYQTEIDRARREAREIVERSTRGAEQQREEILVQARQEAHELILRAQQQAQREIQEGQIALREQVVELGIAIAARLIEEELDASKHHQLIDEFLADVEQLE
ncbi:MAG: F0F1 ATP synthase subunit B [Anaerolineae bacterium]|nr:F0F1 ATP synthase subunit B [Anaerolineae bacterium]